MSLFKSMTLTTITLIVLGSPALIGEVCAEVDAGKVLASYSLESLTGADTRLSSFKDDVLVVNIWASWCAPCRKELPIMDQWHSSWANRGARVVAISIDKEIRNARRFAEKEDLSLTVLYDGTTDLARTLELPSLPCTYVIDREGNVVAMIQSSKKEDLAALHETVELLLGSAPARSLTQGETP